MRHLPRFNYMWRAGRKSKMGIAELKRDMGRVAPERSEGEHGEPCGTRCRAAAYRLLLSAAHAGTAELSRILNLLFEEDVDRQTRSTKHAHTSGRCGARARERARQSTTNPRTGSMKGSSSTNPEPASGEKPKIRSMKSMPTSFVFQVCRRAVRTRCRPRAGLRSNARHRRRMTYPDAPPSGA